MKPFPAREVDAALLRKAFVKRPGDHAYYHVKYRGGYVGASTKIWHGERELGPGLRKRMRAQMRLEANADFGRFVDCPLTFEENVVLLKRLGIISDD